MRRHRCQLMTQALFLFAFTSRLTNRPIYSSYTHNVRLSVFISTISSHRTRRTTTKRYKQERENQRSFTIRFYVFRFMIIWFKVFVSLHIQWTTATATTKSKRSRKKYIKKNRPLNRASAFLFSSFFDWNDSSSSSNTIQCTNTQQAIYKSVWINFN